jgi:hypothetical protein
MPINLSKILTSVILFVLCAPTAFAQDADDLDPLPAWNYTQLRDAAVGILHAETPNHVLVRLLTWHTAELKGWHDKPYRIDAALLWLRFSNAKGKEQWALMDLYFHPGGVWLEDVGLDPKYPPVRLFDSPPHNSQVYAFLKYWPFNPSRSKIVAGAVREKTWKQAIGESPTKSYLIRNPSIEISRGGQNATRQT